MLSAIPEGPTLWCATSADHLALIADAHWRAWPPGEELLATGSLDAAVRAARELAQASGTGHVLQLAVTADYLNRYQGGLVPPEGRDALQATLRYSISEYAHYRESLPELELQAAESALGRAIPPAWRRYLQSPCWFHRGLMRTGAFVWLYPPAMSAELSCDDFSRDMFVIGGNGASEQLVLDLHDQSPRVMLTNVVRAGWQETIAQAISLPSFLTEIEAGTFSFAFS